jgi:hypothetical protein
MLYVQTTISDDALAVLLRQRHSDFDTMSTAQKEIMRSDLVIELRGLLGL